MLVISSSLHPNSRSRLLAGEAVSRLRQSGHATELFDLSQTPLPACDGDTAYGHADVTRLAGMIESASAVIVASPVYNYDVNAAVKNAVELTGRAWTGKVVGLMLAAGGAGSYMSAMGLANSLMLDFRCLIVPRFVYATGDAFEGDAVVDEGVLARLQTLIDETLRLSAAIR